MTDRHYGVGDNVLQGRAHGDEQPVGADPPQSQGELAAADGVMRTLRDADSGALDPQRDHDRGVVFQALFGAPGPGPRATADVPRRFGRYEVLERIGEGAMGEVYRAVDTLLERDVAIKVVHRRLAALADRGAARLLQEARSLAKLRHANVVAIYEAGVEDGRAWIAMEYVDGDNLRGWLRAAPRSADEILRCLVDAGRGLAAAHAAGLVHRDFKPDNVLVDRQGRARVGDFGLVRAFQDSAPSSQPTPGVNDKPASGPAATREGAIVGTPAYMPPEQLAGDPVDGTCDQFAFCVTAWEALFGARPFSGSDPIELCAAILAGNHRKRRAVTGVSRRVERALRRGLSARADARFRSIDALLDRLEPVRRRRLAAVVTTVTVALGLGSLLWARNPTECDAGARHFAGAWNEATAQQVSDAIGSSGLPYAPTTAVAVVERLDTRRHAWIEVWRDTCLARSAGVESSEQLDRRSACLHARRADTAALVGQLAVPNARTYERAQAAIDSLPPIAICNRIDGDSPQVAEDVREHLDPLLAATRALHASGQDAAAFGVGQTAELEASRLQATVLLAEARLELGAIRLGLGDRRGAVAAWLGAVNAAVAADDEGLQAQGWIALAEIAANEERDRGRAEEWLDHAQAVVQRLDGDESAGLRLALARSFVTALKDPAAALALARDVADRGAAGSPEEAGVADRAELAQAPLLLDLARFDEAASLYRGRLRSQSALYGVGHPRVADAWLGLGIALDRTGDAGAEPAYERALEIWTAAWPNGHRDIGTAHIALANVSQKRGDLAAATEHADAAVAEYRRVLPEGDIAFGEAWTLLGVLQHRKGDFAGAAKSHDEARHVYEASGEDGSVYAAIARNNAAEARLAAGEDGQAAEFQAAYDVIARVSGAESPYLGYPLKGLGIVAIREGRVDEGRRILKDAQRLCEIDETECDELRGIALQTTSDKRRTVRK